MHCETKLVQSPPSSSKSVKGRVAPERPLAVHSYLSINIKLVFVKHFYHPIHHMRKTKKRPHLHPCLKRYEIDLWPKTKKLYPKGYSFDICLQCLISSLTTMKPQIPAPMIASAEVMKNINAYACLRTDSVVDSQHRYRVSTKRTVKQYRLQ